MPATVVSITEDLWKNARDSIFHALEHFLELSLKEGEKFHHTKWIVLSVHHLAETFCGMLLKEFDPTNAIFKRGQQDSWPSLVPEIDELLAQKYRSRLTGGEIRLLDLLRGLNDSRNRIMHGVAPEGLDLSLAAMSILRIGDGTCLGTLRQETPQRTYYNRQVFCSGLPRLHEIQSMDLLGGYPAQILPFFDGQLWTAPI